MTADRPATEPHEHHKRFDMDNPWLVCDCGGYWDAITGEPMRFAAGFTNPAVAEAAQGAAPLLRSREEEMAIRMAKPIADLFGSLPAHDPATCRRCVPRAEGLPVERLARAIKSRYGLKESESEVSIFLNAIFGSGEAGHD